MFWDNVTGIYDIFEKVINKKSKSRFVGTLVKGKIPCVIAVAIK